MKRIIILLTTLMMGFLTLSGHAESTMLDLVAKEINKTCPQSVDEYTTMLRVESTATDFIYSYSLDNEVFGAYEEFPTAIAELKKMVLEEVRNLYVDGDEGMKYFYELLVEYNRGLKYIYFNEEATDSISVRINPAEMKAIVFNGKEE
ncbi:MAG: hypothetical protein J6J06_09040 [Bacteroidaceae bacterium]|nr:hypothetical protein [Bacteroidaceae bacterium]